MARTKDLTVDQKDKARKYNRERNSRLYIKSDKSVGQPSLKWGYGDYFNKITKWV